MSATDRMVICLVALVIAGFLWWRKKGPKVHAVAMFLAVGGLVGGALGGWLTVFAVWLAHWLILGENKLVVAAFGQSDPGVVLTVIALAAIGIVLHDLWPKNSAKRITVIIAGLAPLLMLAAGGQLASAAQGNFGAAAPAAVTVTSGNLNAANLPATIQVAAAHHPGV